MKYCEKCGNQLLDEAVMCPKCGCAVSGRQLTSAQNEYGKNRYMGIRIIAAIAIVVLTIIAVIAQING